MITVKHGDVVRFTCQFQHKGIAYTGAKLTAVIGKKKNIIGSWGWFDDILKNEIAVTGIKDDANWTVYQLSVDVMILSGTISPGTNYEAYVKLSGIPGDDIIWEGPADDIAVEGTPGTATAQFSDLQVSYKKG